MSNDNMALLAAASYADFKDVKDSNSLQKALIREMPEAQAEKFTNTYELIAHKTNTFEFGMLFDKPHNKVSGVLDDFINKNRSINREKLEIFIKQSFLEDDKYHYRKQIPWPESYTGNTTPTNKFSFTPSSEIAKNKTQDFDYFSATRTLSLGFNKEALNKSTKTSDLASSSIITDDTRIANHNLVILKSIDIANYVVSNLPGTNHVKLNRAQGKPFKIAIDPLILDLNGDGARAFC